MPFFLNPFAFAAFAAVPVLVGIYYLRNRYRRRVVSSLILWQGIIKGKEGGKKKDKLQLPWLFILEMLAIICLAMAATQPLFRYSGGRIPVSVILDDSFSMSATSSIGSADLQSVRERGMEYLQELIDQNIYEFEFLLAGENPIRIGETKVVSRDGLDQILEDWKCQQSSANLNDALQQVKRMNPTDSRILVLTDHLPEFKALEGDPRLRWISLGSPEENVAISFASRNSAVKEGTGDEQLLIKLERFSPDGEQQPKKVEILIKDQADNSILARSSSELLPQSAKEVRLNLPEVTGKRDLKIEIQDDAVSSDNSITLLAESPKEISVFLAIDDENYLKFWREALQVIPNVKINESPSVESHLVITQSRFELQSEQWHVYCPSQSKPVAFAGPYALSTGHPLTNGLPINNAIWAASPAEEQELDPEIQQDKTPAKSSDQSSPDSVTNDRARALDLSVLRSGQTDLVTETLLSNGRKRIQINLEPSFSTINLSPPSWLVLVVNLIKWRESHLHGPEFRNTWRNSQSIRFPLQTNEALVTSPTGSQQTVGVYNGIARVETFENGVWQIESAGGAETNTQSWNWSFFSMSAHESDLSDSESGSFDNWLELESESKVYYQPFAWLFGLVGLTMFVAGCFFSKRGQG